MSQFTLHGYQKPKPAIFYQSGPSEVAIPLYEQFLEQLATDSQCAIQTGKFGAMMEVTLVNDGPVTIIIDSKNREWPWKVNFPSFCSFTGTVFSQTYTIANVPQNLIEDANSVIKQ